MAMPITPLLLDSPNTSVRARQLAFPNISANQSLELPE
jgi:hypothetical protein